MSTYGDNIRKISRYDELKKLINQQSGVNLEAKSSINGARSTAYLNPNTDDVQAAAAGAVGATKPRGTTNQKLINEAGDRAGEAGQTAGAEGSKIGISGLGEDLATGDNSDRDGFFDTESVLDYTVDAAGKAVASAGYDIRALTGLFTDDGTRSIVVHVMDAAFAFIPPVDRTGAFDGGGLVPDWAVGFYFSCVSFRGTSYETTFLLAGAAEAAAMVGYNSVPTNSTITSVEFTSTTYVFGDTSGDYQVDITYTHNVSGSTFVVGANLTTTRISCVASPSALCVATNPTQGDWNDLGITQLAWASGITPRLGTPFFYDKAGRFVPNPFDVNVPIEFQDGASILDLQSTDGAKVRVGPLRDGGWYVYYRDVGNSNLPVGAATANSVFTVQPNNASGGYITPNQLTKMLPM